jgi:hypothetical protein
MCIIYYSVVLCSVLYDDDRSALPLRTICQTTSCFALVGCGLTGLEQCCSRAFGTRSGTGTARTPIYLTK